MYFIAISIQASSWIIFQFWRHVQGSVSTYTLVHTVTFTVPQSGAFQSILPQERRDWLEAGDVMGYSTIHVNVSETILPWEYVTCSGQSTIGFVHATVLMDTMTFTAIPDNCRKQSLQMIFAGR